MEPDLIPTLVTIGFVLILIGFILKPKKIKRPMANKIEHE